jgi:hypothetical protein
VERKHFTTNDAGFVCASCGSEVLPLGSSSRNHCPACLVSLHVDVNPGDRACGCRGLMRPIGVETEGKRGFVLVHRCERCGAVRRNRAVTGAATQPDDMDRIIELSAAAAPLQRAGRSRRGRR